MSRSSGWWIFVLRIKRIKHDIEKWSVKRMLWGSRARVKGLLFFQNVFLYLSFTTAISQHQHSYSLKQLDLSRELQKVATLLYFIYLFVSFILFLFFFFFTLFHFILFYNLLKNPHTFGYRKTRTGDSNWRLLPLILNLLTIKFDIVIIHTLQCLWLSGCYSNDIAWGGQRWYYRELWFAAALTGN